MSADFPPTGTFVKLPIPVRAERQWEPFEVETLEGIMRGAGGDWLITAPGGEQWPIKDAIFRKTYRLAEPTSEASSGQ